MTPRLCSALCSLPPERVRLSETGLTNATHRATLAGYYADRLLLGWSLVWIGIRWARRQDLMERPEALYDPLTWLGKLAFPTPPSDAVWFFIAAVCALSVTLCLWRPRLIAARATLALSTLLLMAPEFAYGHIEHVNHLFLLAHVLAVFLPTGRPGDPDEARLQARSFAWYQAALLFPYTMAGGWKWLDMTVIRLLKPDMTWLHPDALVVTSVHSYRNYDLPLTVPATLADFGFLYAIGYVVLAYVFVSASLAAFRRPLLPLVLLAIIMFHLTNVVTLYVHFVTTCIVAAILFFPYDRLLPSVRGALEAPASTVFEGRGGGARYVRTYANGDRDLFEGFYAYRERLTDRAWPLAAPLYLPGMAWLADRLIQSRQPA